MPLRQLSGSKDKFLFKNSRQSSARGSVDLLSHETLPSSVRAQVGSGFSGLGNHTSTPTIVLPALVYDEEKEFFRLRDGRFAFSREHADWEPLRSGRLKAWELAHQLPNLPPKSGLRFGVLHPLFGVI